MPQTKEKKYRPKIGDVFEVILENGTKGYVQYIGNDSTQLHSDVVRIFKKRYSKEEKVNLEDLVKGEVEFYSHVMGVKFGVRDGVWEKIGNSNELGDLNAPFFRTWKELEMLPMPKPEVSKNWVVWHMNGSRKEVGELMGVNTKADHGLVGWPKDIVYQMNTGKPHGWYPGY